MTSTFPTLSHYFVVVVAIDREEVISDISALAIRISIGREVSLYVPWR